MANNDITSNQFELPFNAYAAFDALSLKSLMQQRLSQGNNFTDQLFEGSNFNSFLDVIAYSYNVLLFYLNKTGSESLYSQSTIYENMNKIVKSLNYNPVGNQSSVLSFSAVGTENLPANVYTTPRFSYFTLNGINYSFTNDATFLKGSNSVESLDQLSDNNVLKQGIFVEYPIYIATGDAFEEFTIVSVSEAGVNDIIDHSSIFVFVKDESNRWSEWNRVSNLYLESPTSTTFECRFNENQRYTLKFGNDITGKRLKTGYQVAVYYLKSDGTSGEIGPGVLSNNQMFLYNTPLYNDIMSNIRDANQNFLTSQQATNIVFSNPYASTSFTVLENTDAIRTNAANTFKTQYRLITTTDYENFIKTNYSNLIKDVKVVNNWEYLAEHVRYLYNLGLKTPSLDSRVLFNQLTFSDSCDFNNIYVYMVPRLQNNTLFSNFLPTGLKDLVINGLQEVKMTTAEIVVMDPVYTAVAIGVASNAEINNFELTPELINETRLIIGRDPNSRLNPQTIKDRVSNVFKGYFSRENTKLGQQINLESITSQILSLEGVTSITCRRNVNGQNIDVDGLSFLVWNPVYSAPREDITILNQTVQLGYYKIPFLYNYDDVLNQIDVVTPDTLQATVREY
jgi:hypothetical protein